MISVFQEKYVERVIQQAMALISPSRIEQLSPAEAVKLYQQFSVMLIFLSYSPRVTFFIRNNYMEEFKYVYYGFDIASYQNACFAQCL